MDNASKIIQYAQEKSIRFKHQEAQECSILGSIPEWVKLTFENHSIHYSFEETGLGTVTLQSIKA